MTLNFAIAFALVLKKLRVIIILARTSLSLGNVFTMRNGFAMETIPLPA
jgi:hypothetical protein